MKNLSIILAGSLLAAAAYAAPLIMEAEASLPNAQVKELRTRGITRGPAIRQISPEPNAPIKSPFNLKVVFEPRGGAAIDMASVNVVYLKSPSVDLIERVRPGLNERGINLSGAEAPVGEHHIRISLHDSDGRQTNSIIKLTVAK
jgi:hypothetical protein